MKKIAYGLTLGLAGVAAMASTPTPTLAEAGDLIIRARAIYVEPDESAVLTPINGTAEIDGVVTPELDFTYFFTDNIAAELILATTRHSPSAIGTTLGDVELGKVSLLPPTLTLQYHFINSGGIKPYIGAGVNLTLFYNVDLPAATVTDIDYSDSFGFALQAGVDVPMNDDWFINLDVKKLFLNTDVTINSGAITGDVDINPWIFGIGFGKKF